VRQGAGRVGRAGRIVERVRAWRAMGHLLRAVGHGPWAAAVVLPRPTHPMHTLCNSYVTNRDVR
jgi:hypothetical protein